MRRLLSLQPLLTTVTITAAVDLVIAYGAPIPPGAKAPIITIITALATLFVHQSVASPTTVVNAVTDAATRTAEQLTTTTVGAVGDVTAAGEGVVTGVVGEVLNSVGGLVASANKGA